MARKTVRRLLEKSLGSEWERLVKRVERSRLHRVLIIWNRGLGDVALGMAPVVDELRRRIPHVSITILTRPDLAEAFEMLGVDGVVADPAMRRQQAIDVKATLQRLDIRTGSFDVIVPRPDPTHWFEGVAVAPPRLRPPSDDRQLAARFDAQFAPRADAHGEHGFDIGVHLSTETGHHYRYSKDWPIDAWRELFARIRTRYNARFILFGHATEPALSGPEFIDLRGRTSLADMLALIKNRCRMLIAPDSGVLTMTYYLDLETPIDVISLWADPRQGVLKRNAASPNPLLRHRPVLAPGERIEHLSVDSVFATVDAMLKGTDESVDALAHTGRTLVSS